MPRQRTYRAGDPRLPDYSRKLSEDDVREIRRRYDANEATQAQLAREFGVSRTWMSYVCRRKDAWVNV